MRYTDYYTGKNALILVLAIVALFAATSKAQSTCDSVPELQDKEFKLTKPPGAAKIKREIVGSVTVISGCTFKIR
jgi:hypothetical protein